VFSQKFNLSLSLGLAESALEGWSRLMTGSPLKDCQSSETLIEEKLQKWEADKHVVSIGGYYTLKGIAQHYLGDYNQAAVDLMYAQPYLRGLSDNILNRLWYVFRYLNGLQLNLNDVKERLLLEDCLKSVATWAELGVILKPYFALMLAERAHRYESFSEARRCYLDAIDCCRKEKFILLEGFIKERFAQLLIKNQHEYANYYLQRAVSAYQHCGATVKATQLIENYSLNLPTARVIDENAEITLAHLLDVNYLVQATRGITSQLNFDSLLTVIIKAVMERLGAKQGYLLIPNDKSLEILAKGIKHDNVEIEIKNDHALSDETLSWAVVNYVYRTLETVVLENASATGDFITDEVVVTQQLKSIFCLPLLKQQKILGVLYLENNLITSVFNPEHIELTKLLTAQAAIALENTLLITEMKNKQQEIQAFNEQLEARVVARTEELNKVNEELKNFAYVVSHDLKAPLRAINQLAGWIEEDYANSFDDDGRAQMSLLRSRARKMHDMIDGILQYSRIGRVKEAMEWVDLNTLVRDVIEAISPPAHIQMTVQENLPSVYGEKLRIYQVLQNLLDNAVKYNDKTPGQIQLRCQDLVEFEDLASLNGSQWCFCVEDNGIGIDKPYQQKVFQLFQTLEPKDQTNSTGVGLSLVEKIIHTWGGKIWLDSTLGEGSRFFFTFPKQQEYVDE
jgi:signal transduction histidine kinase